MYRYHALEAAAGTVCLSAAGEGREGREQEALVGSYALGAEPPDAPGKPTSRIRCLKGRLQGARLMRVA